ncbi:MAG: LptF/LptG family permease [Bacteroidales bacterium]|nr:LptF/LptG family permease [Bacteroidales bacterium]
MKRLYWLVIKSFLGPFVLTFFIVMFVLLMQFLWRYIDDLVGKGLEINIISELLLYTSASLVSLALPLSILMSSLMTFGSLGEYYELTAIKSSGISLQRIMKPLIVFVIMISIGAFFFSNYVLPYTNLKMRALLWDVKQQRPELQIREGEFYNGIDDYSIRINKKNPQTNTLYDLKIYDHTQKRGNVTVIIADSGYMKMTADESNLLINLWSGYSYNEQEEDRRKIPKTYPHRTDKFKEQRIIIELTGFGLQRTDENLFKNDYQMMSLKQLTNVTDSLNNDLYIRENQFARTLLTYNLFKSKYIKPVRNQNKQNKDDKPYSINIDSLFQSLDYQKQHELVTNIMNSVRSTKSYVESSCENLKYKKKLLRRHEIEWHRKFTLSIACLIFLFIGAPLGAIIRKGGLGMPTVVSVFLFIFYYIISLTGEKIVRESVVTSFQGMWMSSFSLFIVGVFLTYKATTDSAIFNIDMYIRFFNRLFGFEKTTLLDKKIQLVGQFKYSEVEKADVIKAFGSIIELTDKSISDINQGIRLKNLLQSNFEVKTSENQSRLYELTDQFFETLLTSRWMRIPYLKSLFSEFPYLNFEKPRLFIPLKYRTLLKIIFPVGLAYLLYLSIRQKNIRRRLYTAKKLSGSVLDIFNNPAVLTELEMQI